MEDFFNKEFLKQLTDNPLPSNYSEEDALAGMFDSFLILRSLLATIGLKTLPSLKELEEYPPREFIMFTLGNAFGYYRACLLILSSILGRYPQTLDYERAKKIFESRKVVK